MPRSVTPQTIRSRDKFALIVDEDPTTSQLLGAWFQEAGWSVTSVTTCGEADAAAEQTPDLLLVEERLGDGSGLDLFLRLQERNPMMLGVVLARHGSISSAVQAIRMGFRDYLVKPIDRRRLAELLGRPANDVIDEYPSLERVEWAHINAVLGLCNGNISEAARRLGIHRRSLQRRLRRAC